VHRHSVLGQRINNYELKELIGEGGMGAVYLAEHPVLHRQVAVKILHPMFAKDGDLVARFFNEARAANAIGHQNIIDVMDVGTLPDGLPYLIMELLRGESLASRIDAGRLEVPMVLELGKQATSALGAAHTVGIVHRDLKPANLFLATDRENPSRVRLKVLDFGIAKLAATVTSNQVKTGTGSILATPAYMSPEQGLGRSSAIDSRTDIYSLGVILYHALAGEPPFAAEGFGELLVMHMKDAPPPLCSRNPAVSPALEALIDRALAKQPGDRFQTMAEMGQALHALDGEPARPGSANARVEPPTMVLEPSQPRTVRLGAGSPTGDPSLRRAGIGFPSTTLSTTASQIGTGTVNGNSRRFRGPLMVGGALVAVVGAALGMTMMRPNRRGPTPVRTGTSAAAPLFPVPSALPAPAPPPAPLGKSLVDESPRPAPPPLDRSSTSPVGQVETSLEQPAPTAKGLGEPPKPVRKRVRRPVVPAPEAAHPEVVPSVETRPLHPAAPPVREPIKF
jgi:serine/threonine protein kinase